MVIGIIPYVIILVAQISIAFAMWRWGCAVASRRRGAWWRWWARAPLVALALAFGSGAAAALSLKHAFAASAYAEPSLKAMVLAKGISEAMNAAAFLALPAVALYLASAIVLLIGSLAAPRA